MGPAFAGTTARSAVVSLLPVPDHDHLHHLVVDIGVRHRRALDEQPVALEADEARLLTADPGLVPGRFYLGDDPAVLDPVAARIGDHAGERAGALLVGLRHRAVLGGDEREPAPVRGGDLAAARLFA